MVVGSYGMSEYFPFLVTNGDSIVLPVECG